MGKFTLLAVFLVAAVAYAKADNKVVCYYNSQAHFREGKFVSSQFQLLPT